MSANAEPVEHQKELEQDNEEQLDILKAILVGIALVADVKPKELIALAKGLK